MFTATPLATPSARPTAKGEKDAFLVTYFPWTNPSAEAFPQPGNEGKVKVVNSIFFEEPPFFGFDIQSGGQWYHVVGVDEWAVADAERISPVFQRYRCPGDGDMVVVYGQVREQFIIASYVGFADGTPYYYRSLLHADELRSGLVPAVYNGLEVWVRGILDAAKGQGQFYRLPEGTTLDPSYLGQEALVAGRLFIGESIGVTVTKGIYTRSGSHYANILQGEPPASAEPKYEQGIIQAMDQAGQLAVIQSEDGRLVEVYLNKATRIAFADGSQANLAELSPGRRIETIGQVSGRNKLSAAKVTIVSAITHGRTYAAYIAGENGDLWSVSIVGLERRQITHLVTPEPGLGNAEFSPDGLRFVFARQHDSQATLVLGDLQSGKVRELLTDDEWQETDPAWSPEGSRIAFCRYNLRDEQRSDGGLWLLNLSNGTVKQLCAAAEEGWLTTSPRWSPDGKHIAFGQATYTDERLCKLYVLSLPADSRLVLENVSEWRWAVDSSQLLCTRQAPDERRARLWVVQRDGSSATWLSPAGVHDHYGRWSPDGTAIAFLSRPEGSSGRDYLWVMEADGMRRLQLTDDEWLAANPCWSADSQAILFMKVTTGGVYDGLWMIERDGEGLRELASDAVGLAGTYQSGG